MTKTPLKVRQYVDPNGQPGVGALRTYAARPQHAILWLWEGDFRKYEPHELDQHGIVDQSEPEEPAEVPEPDEVVESTGTEPDNAADQTAEDPASDAKPEEFVSEAQSIRDYLSEHPTAENQEVIDALAERNIEISSGQVTRQRNKLQGS